MKLLLHKERNSSQKIKNMKKVKTNSIILGLLIMMLFFFIGTFNMSQADAQVTITCPTGDRQICWSDSTIPAIVYKGGEPRKVEIQN